MTTSAIPNPPSTVWIYVRGLAIPMLMVVGWMGYYAANNLGIPEQHGTATVVSKQVVEAGSNFHTTIVGGHAYVQSQPKGEAYLIELDLRDELVWSFVPVEVYAEISTGDSLEVHYRRTRFGGSIQMVEIIESSLRKG